MLRCSVWGIEYDIDWEWGSCGLQSLIPRLRNWWVAIHNDLHVIDISMLCLLVHLLVCSGPYLPNLVTSPIVLVLVDKNIVLQMHVCMNLLYKRILDFVNRFTVAWEFSELHLQIIVLQIFPQMWAGVLIVIYLSVLIHIQTYNLPRNENFLNFFLKFRQNFF